MTKRNQRIAIWVIAIVLTLGTLGSFLVVALEYKNYNDEVAVYREMQAADKKKAASSIALDGYATDTFTASDVTKLNVEVLSEGTGKTIKKTDTIKVSYFGWMPDGTIFDSTTKKGQADSPIEMSLKTTITGWQNGLTGQKVGSTVKLTIPSDQAYGTSGTDVISADTPLKFIIIIKSIQ